VKRYTGVRQIEQGLYEINYRPYKKAKRVFKRVKASSMQEAYLKRIKLISEYDMSNKMANSENCNITFKVLKERLKQSMEVDRCRKKTINRSLLSFKIFFFEFLTTKYPRITNLNSLSIPVFEAYKNFVVVDLGRDRGWRSELGTLKTMFGRFVRSGFCEKRIIEDLSEFKKPPAVQRGYKEITRTDKRNLLGYVEKDRSAFYGITYFLMRLGWRIEETLSIRKKNIKWNGLTPVEIKIEAPDRKNNREFVFDAMDEDLARVIKRHAFKNKRSEWLFPNRKGNRTSSNHYRIYLAEVSQKVIGKRLTPHDFRHSLVTEMALKNAPIRDVMAITGHTDINTVLKHYSHSTKKGKEQVLENTKF